MEVDAVWQRAIEQDLPRELPAFLVRQRWFGAKARAIVAAAVEDVVPLGDSAAGTGEGPPPALLVTGLTYADGGTDRYALIVALSRAPADLPAIARLGERGPWLVESATDPRAAMALLAALEARDPIPALGGGRLQGGDAFPGPAGVFRPSRLTPEDLRPLKGEQSNTSIRCGEAHVFKLLRRLETGESPELEIGRFLIERTRFRASPALRGSITYQDRAGSPTSIGIVQDWITNDGDGWQHVVRGLAALRGGEGAPPDGSPGVPALQDEMRDLGATTAEFHQAMASDARDPAFAPEPARGADVEAWSADLRARAHRLIAQLAASPLAPEARELAVAFAARENDLGRVPGAPAFARIRVHGDYHLGQTLRTAAGYVLVDFEGEPARTLAERRAKHCALKDVAGMLRSFDYAVEAAGLGAEAGARERIVSALRTAFLDGYRMRAREGQTPFLPADREGFEAWTAFFELDKAVYEVAYELNHRPHWVSIPLRGVRRIMSPPERGTT